MKKLFMYYRCIFSFLVFSLSFPSFADSSLPKYCRMSFRDINTGELKYKPTGCYEKSIKEIQKKENIDEYFKPFKLIQEGTLEHIKSTIENGLDVNTMFSFDFDKFDDSYLIYDKYTLIMFAAKSREADIVKYLIEKGADIHKGGGEFELFKPIKMALESNSDPEVTKELIKAGALATLKADEKFELLYIAISKKRLPIIKLLVEKYDVNINERDGYGGTPLFYAAKFNNIKILKYFIDKGANLNLVNNKGFSALDISVLNKQNKSSTFLKKVMQSLNILNKKEPTLDIVLEAVNAAGYIDNLANKICGKNNFMGVDVVKKGKFNTSKNYLPVLIKVNCQKDEVKNNTPIKVFYSDDFLAWRTSLLEE